MDGVKFLKDHGIGSVLGEIGENEGMPVIVFGHNGRTVVRAWNEGGYNFTDVGLHAILKWVAENRPEWLVGHRIMCGSASLGARDD